MLPVIKVQGKHKKTEIGQLAAKSPSMRIVRIMGGLLLMRRPLTTAHDEFSVGESCCPHLSVRSAARHAFPASIGYHVWPMLCEFVNAGSVRDEAWLGDHRSHVRP